MHNTSAKLLGNYPEVHRVHIYIAAYPTGIHGLGSIVMAGDDAVEKPQPTVSGR